MFVKNCFYFNILKSFMIYGESRCEAIKGWKNIDSFIRAASNEAFEFC